MQETTNFFLEYAYVAHVEDDWVLFEQEALLRERESESEEEGSEGSGSTFQPINLTEITTIIFLLILWKYY